MDFGAIYDGAVLRGFDVEPLRSVQIRSESSVLVAMELASCLARIIWMDLAADIRAVPFAR